MASGNAVWGIDVGQCALKAIKLRPAEAGKVEAVAFDVIEHPKILSQPDADRDELIRAALAKFVSRNEWQGDRFVVGVPGQQTFARFCKMPPIDLKKDAKKIPDLVRYEASQQIPFDIDDVVWDYQLFTGDGSPDVEVGIFAIRKDLIRKHLSYFAGAGISPTIVQTVPAALYNFCQFDGQTTPGGATVLVDVGAQNSDLIIVEANAAWTRNIPLGGNSFTEALVRSFKLSFAKAESLKRTAADSKYARQIFQAMRPVFADLVSEIQRSIGFYSSTHRDVELKKVLALGNAFRLPGLLKYLENNLTLAGGVAKLEKFASLLPTATINAPPFTENVLSFAAAYGLALQGLGLGKIRASLLPTELARVAVWQKKKPYFIAAAATLALGATIPYVANALDRQALASEAATTYRNEATRIVNEAKRFQEEYQKAKADTSVREQDVKNLLSLQQHKALIPRLAALPHEAMPPIQPPDLAEARSAQELRQKIQSDPLRYDRTKRGQLIIESLKIEYVKDIAAAKVDAGSVRTTAGVGGRGGMAPSASGAPPGDMSFRGRGGGRFGGPPMMEAPAPAPAAKESKSGAPAAISGGCVVRVKARLLYGRSEPDAIAWLTQTYYQNLRELGQRPGLGFYIPPDDPKDDTKRGIGLPDIRRYRAAAVRPGQALPAADTTGPQYPDPVTGEETATDWSVEFAFKVVLGEMPKPGAEGDAKDNSAAAGGAPPAARGPRGGRG